MASFSGTAGDDYVHVAGDHHGGPGSAHDLPLATDDIDQIDVSQGGDDTVFAGGGDDTIFLGNALTRDDRIVGGLGYDIVTLQGSAYANFRINSSVFGGIEQLNLLPIDGASTTYRLNIAAAAIADSETLKIDGHALGAADTLYVDASEQVGGELTVVGGAGNDTVIGGFHSIDVSMFAGGNDTVIGTDTYDTFNFGKALDIGDHIDGGFGIDTVLIYTAIARTLTLSGSLMRNIEILRISSGAFTLTTTDSLVAPGSDLWVYGPEHSAAQPLKFDGSAEKDGGYFHIYGTPGRDTLTGGFGGDSFTGGAGKDVMTGRAGADTFYYNAVSDSTGVNYDTLVQFDFAGGDRIDNLFGGRAIDRKVAHGTLSTTTFDTDLAAAVNDHRLGVDNALVFTPDQGTLAGHIFVVIDGNNVAGYQANADIVIEFVDPLHLGSIDPSDFAAM